MAPWQLAFAGMTAGAAAFAAGVVVGRLAPDGGHVGGWLGRSPRLRRGFATGWSKRGRDIDVLSRHLGRGLVQTSEIHLAFLIEEERQRVAQAGTQSDPLAVLSWRRMTKEPAG